MECKIIKLAYLLIPILLISCKPEKDKLYWYQSDSYIFEYVQYNNIALSTGSSGEIIVKVIAEHSYGAFSTNDTDIAKYNEKCLLYNDYNHKVTFWTIDKNSYENCVQDRDFKGINIYSDKDFKDSFPAGSNLSSLFYMASRSPYKYIESRYKNVYNATDIKYPSYYEDYLNYKVGIDFTIGGGIHPVYGVLSELTADDMKLLGFGNHWVSPFEIFTLYPICQPKDKSIHKISIELIDCNENTLIAYIDVDFSSIEK